MRMAGTSAPGLVKFTGDKQKVVRITAFDLQSEPAQQSLLLC